ncbi:Alpha/Beta hydrolase protein [Pisolithus marmoratus]|nr:Alpha/Beta hydrolase protein [Pisolithus marmoratus]
MYPGEHDAPAFHMDGPLTNRGKAFDPQWFLVFCANVLGSPYGTASPVTIEPDTPAPYDPLFLQTTIRDNVRLCTLVLYHLGVSGIAVAIGGLMGCMAVLEWPLCTSPYNPYRYIRPPFRLVYQFQGTTTTEYIQDPVYKDGDYDTHPSSGLAAARMAALLTYRSRDFFEKRFGRRQQIPPVSDLSAIAPSLSRSAAGVALASKAPRSQQSQSDDMMMTLPAPPIFSGAKLVSRFDANCYIRITRRLDTHDVACGRTVLPEDSSSTIQTTAPAAVLATIPRRALVISVETDELATHIPEAELVVVPSPDGHDGYLLEFEHISKHIRRFLKTAFPEYYVQETEEEVEMVDFRMFKPSLFGEAEVDVTIW